VIRGRPGEHDGPNEGPPAPGDRTGYTIVVTGANSGIGSEVARALVARGAHVVLAVRDPTKGEQAAGHLTGPGSTSVVELDLADLDSVAQCAKTLLERHDHLSALVCNAGVMGGPLQLSAQGFELQMATNHLGHVALIAALWPLLHASASRIVLVSSGEARAGQLSAHTTTAQLLKPSPYDGRQVYRNSKQANLLFAQELHRRCAQAGSPVSVVAVHPGAVGTNLFARQLVRAGRHRLAAVSKTVTSVLLPSVAAGARSTLQALDESTPSGAFVAPSGSAQLRGRPRITDVYPAGADPATAAHLWELTEQALRTALPPPAPSRLANPVPITTNGSRSSWGRPGARATRSI
jgi:NAD(P)-dependent dehydrogenase (short-subunit alcohol dehydrogenase family)